MRSLLLLFSLVNSPFKFHLWMRARAYTYYTIVYANGKQKVLDKMYEHIWIIIDNYLESGKQRKNLRGARCVSGFFVVYWEKLAQGL